MKVLILGARAPASLEWARAFTAAGCTVLAADSLRLPLTRFSRACRHYFNLPPPRHEPAAWCARLAAVVQEHGVDWVLPTCEEVFYLAWCRARLPQSCRVFTSDFALLARLHNKGTFAALTQDLPLRAPPTRLLATRAAAAALQAEADRLVFKPAYSRFGVHTLLRPMPEQLMQLPVSAAQPWVAQDFVEGREICSFSVLHGGALAAHACYHPRYRAGRGAGIYFEPAASQSIEDFVRAFGLATGYTGQVGFDFIDTGSVTHVLECNPRATSGVHLLGVQPQKLAAAVLEEGTAPLLHGSAAPRMVGLAMLSFAASRQGASLRFWRDVCDARDVVGAARDYGPAFAQGASVCELVLRAVRARVGLLQASTLDIEWDGLMPAANQ